MIGVAASVEHTAVWMAAGELFRLGDGHGRKLGHARTLSERVPRLVEVLLPYKYLSGHYTSRNQLGARVRAPGVHAGRSCSMKHVGLRPESECHHDRATQKSEACAAPAGARRR